MTTRALEKELKKLDMDERARIALSLLRSLDELSEAENEKLWAAEAARRREEVVSGKAKTFSADEVMKSARALISR